MNLVSMPRRSRLRWFALSLPLLLSAPPLQGQAPGKIAFERFTLENGLDVVLAPDHTTQVAAVSVWYFAGSRDEPPAKAGLARLFDELMFAGSTNVPLGGHATLIERGGGRFDSSIEEDVSQFSQAVPSNRLNQALWLEADRMRGVVINDTTVGQSRAALLSELRDRSGEPYTPLVVETVNSLYDSTACPGYTHPSLGRAASLSAITTKDAADFLNAHFRPNAARLVVSGDFDPVATRQIITSYFGGISRSPVPAAPACTAKPAGAPRRNLTDRFAARPAAGLFYRIPAHDHADAAALDLLGVVLGQGNQSRLNQHLVEAQSAASAIQAGVLGIRQGPSAFGLFAVAAPGVTADSLAALLTQEAAWAASDSITEQDLERARTVYLATAVSRRERPEDVAESIQHGAYYHGSAEAVNSEVTRVMAVTLADLRRVATTWLAPGNAVTLVIAPGGAS
jgi:zinc protease